MRLRTSCSVLLFVALLAGEDHRIAEIQVAHSLFQAFALLPVADEQESQRRIAAVKMGKGLYEAVQVVPRLKTSNESDRSVTV